MKGNLMKRLIFCLSLSLLLLTNAAFPFDAAQNLEVYYPFDQTQGTSVTDTVGPCSGTVTSLDGQALGTFWGAGKFSGGINLDGTEGIIEARASEKKCSIISRRRGCRNIELPSDGEIYTEFLESTVINGKASALSEADPFLFTRICLMCEKSCEKSMFLKIDNEVS
jgi:hypothetical protein